MAIRAGNDDYDAACEWFSAAELAVHALPGLPGDKRAINRRAGKEGWTLRADVHGNPLCRERSGRGGGWEFHFTVLPASALLELTRRGVLPGAPGDDNHLRVGGWSWYDRQSGKAKDEARARVMMVEQVTLLMQSGSLNKSAAIAQIATQHSVSSQSIWNYMRDVKGVARADWEPALCPRWKGGGAKSEVDADVWKGFVSDYLRAECPTLTSCYDRAKEVADERGLTIPSEKTFQRKLEADYTREFINYKRKGDEHVRRGVPAQRRSVAHLHALEIVNIDGHQFDNWVESPLDGKACRVTIVAIQDVMSSKFLSWCIDISENSIQTQIAFGNLFREFGIPKACLLDNGRAFASKTITGGQKSRFRFKIKENEPTGVLTAMEVNAMWALPYRGQSKPIERAFRDFGDRIAKHPAAAGAYTGNRPTNKPHNYGDRVVPWDEFVYHVEQQIIRHNARVGRRGRHYAGRSFDVVFNESYAATAIKKATPEQIRLALLTAQPQTVNRQTGEIAMFGNRYWNPIMGEYKGQRLMVRFDPEDLHSDVYVYTLDGKFLTAAEVITDTGFDTKAAARVSEKRHKDVLRKQRELDKAENLYSAAQVAARLPTKEAPALPEPGVVRMARYRGNAALKIDQEVETALPEEGSKVISLIGRIRPED